MKAAQRIAEHLLKIEAVKLQPKDPFTWASGMRSPIYCDNRVALSYPEVRTLIKQSFVELSGSYQDVTLIAGVASAGIAHGALLADALDLPYCYVRSAPKSHGRQNLIEGYLPANAKVLVIEDLISTGGNAIKAVYALRNQGAEVLSTFAIMQYGFQSAIDAFKQANCTFETLCDYPTLLSAALSNNYITESESQLLSGWYADPEHWYSKNF